MALNRFFGRRKDEAAPTAPAQSDTVLEQPEEDDAALDVDVDPEDATERRWVDRANAVLPTGASTASKRASALYGVTDPEGAPTHFVSARGCRVLDVDGGRFVDCTMALGSVALGYAEPGVVQAVVTAASEGN